MNTINAKNIITEEVQNFLNQSNANDSNHFTFRQTILHPNVYFYNYENFSSDYDADIINAQIIITWKAAFKINDSGIQNFVVIGEGVEGQYLLEFRDKQSDAIVPESNGSVKQINDIQWKFNVSEDIALKYAGALFVKDLEFDFNTNTCTLNFNK